LTSILAVSREAYAMALRKALPDYLASLHPLHNTPFLAIRLSGILMILLILLTDLEPIVAVSTFGLLFYYSLGNISDIKLRLQRNEKPIYPILGMSSCFALMAFLLFTSPYAWIVGLIILITGGIYYRMKANLNE